MDELDRTNQIIDDRYKVIETLGEGGMAIVYHAHDLIRDNDVAIKMLKSEKALSEINRIRFETEARTAAALNHQNIVKVYDSGVYHGIHYIVNEYINGKNLRQLLDIRGKLSIKEALDFMYQLTSAVMYAHNQKVIHRDIKPQNIYVTSGIIKLGDFGIATFENTNEMPKETIIGSVHYLAPELCKKNGRATAKSDIYSLGITFFEMLTGRVPYDSENVYKICQMHESAPFPSIKSFNPKVPDYIEKIISKCVAKDPDDRYLNVEMMRKDIDKALKNPSLLEKKEPFFARLFGRGKK